MSFQCAGFCVTLSASSGRDRPPHAYLFSELVEYQGMQNGSIRTHNAEVVSSSLTLATKSTACTRLYRTLRLLSVLAGSA
jgi:hypothetical protein